MVALTKYLDMGFVPHALELAITHTHTHTKSLELMGNYLFVSVNVLELISYLLNSFA